MAKLKSLSALPLLLLAVLLPSLAKAQDVIIDFQNEAAHDGTRETITKNCKGGGTVSFTFTGSKSDRLGAYFNTAYYENTYYLTLSSSSGNIAVIEYQNVAASSGKTTDLLSSTGTVKAKEGDPDTYVWTGSASNIKFWGASSTTGCRMKRLRLWMNAEQYNPDASWEEEGSGEDSGELTGTPVARTPSVPVNGKAVKMAIVSVRQFSDLVKEYALWKTQQGYEVEEVYAEDYNNKGALTGDAWAKSIQAHLKETRPAFVLIMGDDCYVPPFDGTRSYVATTGETSYVTDYFYGEYSGDYFPEAYVGRFSGYSADDIKAQMDKTKYMSLLPANEGEWLNQSMALHNPASDIETYQGYNFTVGYYKNFPAVSVIESSASTPNSVNSHINEGCAIVSYIGHGLVGSFNTTYTLAHAKELNNEGRYPLVITSTCLTGKFDNGEFRTVMCLAEQMQRMKDAGSVAYLGATREGGSYSNRYFLTGGKKPDTDDCYLGFLRSLFPTSDEDPLNQQSRTLGEAVAMGNYSVNQYVLESMKSITEYNELFGDPTYQPYIQQPKTMEVTTSGSTVAGHLLNVKAAPKSVVCVSQGRKIVGVVLTDEKGEATMKLAVDTNAGDAVLYASAPGYTDWKGSLVLTANDGTQDADPNITTEVKPVLEGSDIIDHVSAQTRANEWKDVKVTGTSGAVYDTWVSSADEVDCVLMQNGYSSCGIVTTTSGGYVRQITIDWVTATGLADCISVFGSNTPYSTASDVWNDSKKGTLIGTIVKGVNDGLIIKDNYKYVALRAENLDCKMESITIGWGGETFEEANEGLTPYEVTIGATGFSTLYCDKDLVVPEGVTAYVAYESESGSSLITKELADGTIPAKTAVILQGTQGVHSFTVSPKKLTAYTGRNELNGTLERVSTSSLGGTIYVLAQPAGKSVGFYRYTGDMLPAHKAYFREVDGKVQGFELNFGDEGDVVTAIDRLSTVNSQLSTAYDLQGRALRQGKSAPQRGLILQNGKKLMVR